MIAVVTDETEVPTYSATAKLFVQLGADSIGLSARDISESRSISQLYGDLATTRPILDAVAASDDVPFSSDELRGKIHVDESRSFIEITVVYLDPSVAANVANITATTLISELAARQIAQIAQFQDSLEELGLTNEDFIVATQAADLPVLSVAEEAVPSNAPIESTITRTNRLVLSSLGGPIVALGVVVVRTALDDKIKTEDDFAASTGMTTIGAVPRYRSSDEGEPILLKGKERHHPAIEAYYIIRANMDYALPSDHGVISVLVTSPGPGEGKSTLAANLGVALALEGKSVILVDADLRRPVQHLMFDIDDAESPGMIDVLQGTASTDSVLRPTAVKGMKVMTAGERLSDPNLLLSGAPFASLKSRLTEIADVVIYDSAPVLVVSDTLLLAEGMDLTIMVCEAGRTGRRAARRALDALDRLEGIPKVGVLTKQQMGLDGYGYGNYYTDSGVDGGRISAVRNAASRAKFWESRRNGNRAK